LSGDNDIVDVEVRVPAARNLGAVLFAPVVTVSVAGIGKIGEDFLIVGEAVMIGAVPVRL
jgi:hypothetical protein